MSASHCASVLDCGDGFCEVTALASAPPKTPALRADPHCPHPKRRLRWRSVAAVQILTGHRGFREKSNRNRHRPGRNAFIASCFCREHSCEA